MQRSSVCFSLVVITWFCSAAFAQNQSATKQTPQKQSLKKPAAKEAAPKLTAQQQRGLRILKSVQAEAAGLEPAMQTYVLWQVSHGYRKADAKKADAILRRAFMASRSIQDQNFSEECGGLEQVSHVQRWLQREILLEMMQEPNNEKLQRVEKLVPHASPEAKNAVLYFLAQGYVRSKNLDRARELMNQMEPDFYSFDLAGNIFAAIPASQDGERLTVFQQALRKYENQSAEDQDPDEQDFGVLVTRFWRDLPPDSVLDAIDTILQRSKGRDESKKINSVNMQLTSGESMNFGSEYEYRLFQMLPILRELDSSKAEQLLEEHNEARAALDRYPKGMQSIDANFFGDKPPDETEMPAILNIMSMTDDPVVNSKYQADMQVDGQVMKVGEESQRDPEKAYQDAMKLPLQRVSGRGCPRASGLRSAAFGLAKNNPTLARTAMTEMRRLTQDLDAYDQALLLQRVPEFYLTQGDEDGARAAIKDYMKLGDKLYANDTDSSDPNLAFKGAWPSANVWRTSIQQAGQISPEFAEELLQGIQDPEIAGFERVIYANMLLGAGKSSVATCDCHKNGKRRAIYMTN